MGRIGQEDDRCLQALRAVDRDHAHRIRAGLVEIALDRGLAMLQPEQQSFERWWMVFLIGEGEAQEFVERIVGFLGEALW